jgi:hypothetical protein
VTAVRRLDSEMRGVAEIARPVSARRGFLMKGGKEQGGRGYIIVQGTTWQSRSVVSRKSPGDVVARSQ